MDIVTFDISKKAIIWLIIAFFIAGGIFAYEYLPRYEDPEFSIKEAKVYTPYPGATPVEVEQEVTDRIEKAIQQLGQIKRTTSISEGGFLKLRLQLKIGIVVKIYHKSGMNCDVRSMMSNLSYHLVLALLKLRMIFQMSMVCYMQ